MQSSFSKLEAIPPSKTGLLDEAGCLTAHANESRGSALTHGPARGIYIENVLMTPSVKRHPVAVKVKTRAVCQDTIEALLSAADSHFCRLRGHHLTLTVTLSAGSAGDTGISV